MSNIPSDRQTLDYLIGQVCALKAALLAVVVTLPDLPALQLQLEDVLTKALGTIEPTNAPDEAIDGFQNVADSLRVAAKMPRK